MLMLSNAGQIHRDSSMPFPQPPASHVKRVKGIRIVNVREFHDAGICQRLRAVAERGRGRALVLHRKDAGVSHLRRSEFIDERKFHPAGL